MGAAKETRGEKLRYSLFVLFRGRGSSTFVSLGPRLHLQVRKRGLERTEGKRLRGRESGWDRERSKNREVFFFVFCKDMPTALPSLLSFP